jgi:hypothetical protein
MTDKISDNLRWQMEEAATLPPDDPNRQDVARQVAELGPEAEAEWLELLEQDEKLRLELRAVETPPGLHQRLLTEAPAGGTRFTRWLWRTWAGVAAVALLAVSVWASGLWLGGDAAPNQAASLAPQIVQDHLSRPELVVQSENTQQLVQQLGGRTELPIHIPHLGDGYQLVGGRICELKDQQIVYTRWQRDGQQQSLYQFSARDIALDESGAPLRVSVPATASNSQRHEVVFWPGHNCVYALVTPGSAEVTNPSGQRR